jgi:hypothetical protein
MPEGWQGKAKELGALTREREIKSAIDLLRLVFIYLTEGKSFSGTAALLQLAGICSTSKKAVFTRFQKCGERLRWLCGRIYRNNKAIAQPPGWLGERKAYIVDAGDEPVRGSDKADYRLHYAIGLYDLGTKEMALTATETGEKAGNFKAFGGRRHRDRGPGVLQQTRDRMPIGKEERFFVSVWDATVSYI